MIKSIENHKRVNSCYFSPSIKKKCISKQGLVSQKLLKHQAASKALSKPEPQENNAINSNSFTYLYAIGRGGFGKVWKVESKRTKQLFALKEMLKLRVMSKRSVHSVMNERIILGILNDQFIVNMQYAFQDREKLYLVLDLKTGGDLRYHIGKGKRFTELQAKFLIACMVCGLNYIHTKGVLHRDIKPENLVLDERGYLYITDFGIARIWTAENSKDTSGTPGYMAPEVMFRQDHGIGADYFAVGVILYELMLGRRPYIGRDRKEIRDHMMSKQAKINQPPEGWSLEAVDFANRMVQRKASNRLGTKGFSEVKDHPWLKDFNWKELREKKIAPPFVPKNQDNFDPRTLGDWKDDIDPGLDLASSQKLFSGYSHDPRLSGQIKNAGHKKSASII